jgi:hypothetical protein
MAPKSKFYRSAQGLVLVKAETTPGVDSNPTPQDNALYVIDCKVEEVVEMVNMKRKGGGFRSPGAIPGKRYANVSLTMPAVAPWALPGWESLPEPDWKDLATASGLGFEEVLGEEYVASVKSTQGTWDMSEPGGSLRIVAFVDGSTTPVVLNPDLTDEDDFPDRKFVSAGNIVNGIETAANAADIDVIARKGRLYLKSQDNTVSGAIRVGAASYSNRSFSQEYTVNTAAAGIWSASVEYDGSAPIALGTYDAGGGDTAADIATALAADAASNIISLGLSGLLQADSPSSGVVRIRNANGNGATIDLTFTPPGGGAGTLAAAVETGEVFAELGFPVDESEGAIPVVAYIMRPDSFACNSTVTVYKYYFPDCAKTDDEARLSKATGCAFNPTFNFDANAECTIAFEGKGAFHKPADTTFPDGWVFPTRGDGLVGIGAVMALSDGSGDPARSDPFTKIDFTLNWSVEERTDATANINSSGIASFYLSREESATGSYDPEVVPVTDYDRWENIVRAVRNNLSITYASPGGSVMTIEVDNLQHGSPTDASTTRVQYNQQFMMRDDSDAGDDYIVVTISAVDPGI